MKNSQKILRSLINYLKESGIRFSRVSRDGLKDKAAAEFFLDLRASPGVISGSFRDRRKEIISIAHEAGHIIAYRKMNREESLNYLCAIFAAQGIGLGRISPTGQELVLFMEATASVRGIGILRQMNIDSAELEIVKGLLSDWYGTYEKLCRKEVIKKVREEIIEDKNTAFLIFR